MSEDPIALLLPDVAEEEQFRARRLTTFMRLLTSDARGEAAGSAQVILVRAREDLEQASQARLLGALEELLRAHLEHELGRDEYSWFGESQLSTAAAWSVIQDLRGEWDWLPVLPEPGESALEVAERVFCAFERLLGKDLRAGLWRARLQLVRDGVEAGLASLRALALAPTSQAGRLRPESVAGVCECLLSRGAVREAGLWLAKQTDLFCKSQRLAQLDSWTRVLLGEKPQGIRDAGPLPAALCELREGSPDFLASLPGVSASSSRGERWRSLSEQQQTASREQLGASVLAVFSFHAGVARPIHVETAPGFNNDVAQWLEEREVACTEPGDPQHAMVVELRACLLREEQLGFVALGKGVTKRLTLNPILDDVGEVCGWLHLEFEHHATPSRRGLRELAAGWRDKVLNWNPGEEPSSSLLLDSRATNDLVQARRSAFQSLVELAGLKLGRRRWWGFDLERGEPRLVAQGGEGLCAVDLQAGQGRALRRSLATSGVVHFEEARPGLAVHPDSCSGLVLPIRGIDKVLGCLVVESARRNDLRANDLERLTSIVPTYSTCFRLARFSDWHNARFGVGVHFSAQDPTFVSFADQVIRVAKASAPVSITGPAGSGKRVVARWIVFEAGGESNSMVEVSCVGKTDLGQALEEAGQGFLIVSDLDRSSPEVQQEFCSLLAQERGRANRCRVLIVTRRPLAELVARGELRDDLALALERVKLEIPALSDRREDIPKLADFLTTQIAREEGVSSLRLEDDVLALLWRQSWPGNVRELEGVLTRLVLGQRERRVDLDYAVSVLDKHVAKIPSRRPRLLDLAAALRSTRTASGRINKTRAAAYLGWDPDTLVTRLRDSKMAGIGEGELPQAEAWS